MSRCPSREQLQQFLADALPGEVDGEISAHVDDCNICQQALERLTAVRPSIGLAADIPNPRPDGPTPSDDKARRVVDSQLQRLRGLLPPSLSSRVAGEPPGVTETPRIPGYEIVRELGRGGMAVVYQARHLRLNRWVALKMIRAGEQASAEQLVRFCAEGEIIARLRHPNIVQIYEVGTQDRRPYFALELLEGGNLDTVQDGKPMPARIAASLTATLARAMDYAHGQGIVHRDLKPANILLASVSVPSIGPRPSIADGMLKISDFGLAKNVGSDSSLTQTGLIMGTPNYMAPEQVRGQSEQIGPLTDLYSLGAILYELLTGRPPFLASSALDVLNQVTGFDPAPPSRLVPQVPRDLEVICLKCLEKEPARRYTDAAALADDLRRFLAHEPIRARQVAAPERAWRWARRRPAVAGLLLALTAALLAGSALSTYFAIESSQRALIANARERDARAASGVAQLAEANAAKVSAELLLDRGLELANEGEVAEALHWMLAGLQVAPDPDFQHLIRTHLASWGARVPTLTHWLDTPHSETAFAPDGRTLATAGRAGADASDRRVSLRLWDLGDGRAIGDPIFSEDLDLRSLAFSPDGRTLLAGNGSIQLYQFKPGWATRWDVARRQPIGKVNGHQDCVLCVAWTPDGRRFLTGSRDKTVRVWDAETGRPLGKPMSHPSEVRSLACSPDGRWLLSMAVTTAHLWEIETGEPVGPPMEIEGYPLTCVNFTADGRALLVGGLAPAGMAYRILARRWDPDARSLRGEPREVSHPTGMFASLPDGRVASGRDVDSDGTWDLQHDDGLQIWRRARALAPALGDLTPLHPKAKADALSARFAFATRMAWVPLDHMDRVLASDMVADRPASVVIPHVPLFGSRTRLAISADGTLLATVQGTDGSEAVQVWQANDGRAVGPPAPQKDAVWAMAFRPDGKVLAIGNLTHAVELWDISTGRPLGEPLPQHDIILDLAFSPDGAVLAVATWGGEIRLWDVTKSALRVPPVRHDDRVVRVRFSPDGNRLVSVCGKAAHLWDAHTGAKVATLKFIKPARPEREEIDPEALFSPDGRLLLTSPGFGSFRLWDAETGRALGPPTPPGRSQLPYFAFSPDSRLVVVGREDGTVQVWDVPTSRPLGAPVVQPSGLIGVAFLDNRTFLTASVDGTVRRWPVPIPLGGSIERATLSLRLATGLRMDDGHAVVPLTRRDWETLRRQWREYEGEADWGVVPPVRSDVWHEARARDAEQAGQHFTARWHLDQLLRQTPNEWTHYARRARTHIGDGRPDLAEVDERRAIEQGSPNSILAWFREQAWLAQSRGEWSIASWCLDRLIRARPDQPELRPERARVQAELSGTE